MITGVRQFKLINAFGAEYDITRPEALFHAPSGLGWGMEANVERLGVTYIATDLQEVKQTPSGEMVFRGYEEYSRFLAFCQVGGLVLAYKPINTWYYVKVLINIEKTEISYQNDHLICPVDFVITSYWYERVVAQTSEPEESVTSKTYSYTYSYQYGAGVLNVFDVDLALSSYFKLTIFGVATNPVYRVLKEGQIVKSGKINITIPANQKLIINTNPKEYEIGIYSLNNTKIGSRYSNSDFQTERMFALPSGASQLQVITDDESVPKVMLEVLKRV